MKKLPAVSVIIPLFNAEKYIGECLDSILNQTFQDFEVVVIDDCSTDNSRAVVERYAEKFGGRLNLKKTGKNTGSGTEPRNMGLKFSRGEYVFFMDNDDALTPTALEELYTQAKNFDADVVHCEKYYAVPTDFHLNNAELIKQLLPYSYLMGGKVQFPDPQLLAADIEQRVIFFSQRRLIWNYWVQLIRRDFLVEHSIKAVGIIADDMVFTMCELCTAKNYVIVPNVVYFYRHRADSLIRANQNFAAHLNLYVTMLRDGIKYLDEFLSRYEKFSARPDLKYILFDTFAKQMIASHGNIYNEIAPHELDELLRKEFAGENAALMCLVFNKMNIYRRDLIAANKRIDKLEGDLKLINELVLEYKRIAKL